MKRSFVWRLPFGRVAEVTPQELKTWLDEKRSLQLVDARTTAEFRQGTIGRAQHAPVTDLPQAIEQLNLDPSCPVVVLCLSGHRSVPGTRLLRSRGFEAYSLKGGILAWRQAGFPLSVPKS